MYMLHNQQIWPLHLTHFVKSSCSLAINDALIAIGGSVVLGNAESAYVGGRVTHPKH